MTERAQIVVDQGTDGTECGPGISLALKALQLPVKVGDERIKGTVHLVGEVVLHGIEALAQGARQLGHGVLSRSEIGGHGAMAVVTADREGEGDEHAERRDRSGADAVAELRGGGESGHPCTQGERDSASHGGEREDDDREPRRPSTQGTTGHDNADQNELGDEGDEQPGAHGPADALAVDGERADETEGRGEDRHRPGDRGRRCQQCPQGCQAPPPHGIHLFLLSPVQRIGRPCTTCVTVTGGDPVWGTQRGGLPP